MGETKYLGTRASNGPIVPLIITVTVVGSQQP